MDRIARYHFARGVGTGLSFVLAVGVSVLVWAVLIDGWLSLWGAR